MLAPARSEGKHQQMHNRQQYSPDLNPIELCWSKAKQKLRALKVRTVEALDKAATEVLASILPTDALGWFRHCGYGIQQESKWFSAGWAAAKHTRFGLLRCHQSCSCPGKLPVACGRQGAAAVNSTVVDSAPDCSSLSRSHPVAGCFQLVCYRPARSHFPWGCCCWRR